MRGRQRPEPILQTAYLPDLSPATDQIAGEGDALAVQPDQIRYRSVGVAGVSITLNFNLSQSTTSPSFIVLETATGASRMIDPLPLAAWEGSPDVRVSPDFSNRRRAAIVVMPMSKQRPFTEYAPVRHQLT
jgi:hypothetical protein